MSVGKRRRRRTEADGRSATITIYGGGERLTMRGGRAAEIDVGTLATNVEDFLRKVAIILEKVPHNSGGFALSEFVVSAEISATGKLGVLGIGAEVGGKGGLTFKFVRP